jgi:hypothetical protein
LRRALVRQPEPVEWAEVEPERLPAPGAEGGTEPSTPLPNYPPERKRRGRQRPKQKKTAGFRDGTVDDLVVLALLYTDLLEIAPVP